MVRFKTFKPKAEGRSPVVIGLPGLVSYTEGTRIEAILRDLSKYGIAGYRVGWSSLNVTEDSIRCPIDARRFAQDISETFEIARGDSRVDLNRVGFIGSSIGAMAFSYWLSTAKSN